MASARASKSKTPPPKIAVNLAFDRVRIYFGAVLHLSFKRSAFLGLQSWRYGANNYFIEFTLQRGVITCEYDDATKWTLILSELDKIL